MNGKDLAAGAVEWAGGVFTRREGRIGSLCPTRCGYSGGARDRQRASGAAAARAPSGIGASPTIGHGPPSSPSQHGVPPGSATSNGCYPGVHELFRHRIWRTEPTSLPTTGTPVVPRIASIFRSSLRSSRCLRAERPPAVDSGTATAHRRHRLHHAAAFVELVAVVRLHGVNFGGRQLHDILHSKETL